MTMESGLQTIAQGLTLGYGPLTSLTLAQLDTLRTAISAALDDVVAARARADDLEADVRAFESLPWHKRLGLDRHATIDEVDAAHVRMRPLLLARSHRFAVGLEQAVRIGSVEGPDNCRNRQHARTAEAARADDASLRSTVDRLAKEVALLREGASASVLQKARKGSGRAS